MPEAPTLPSSERLRQLIERLSDRPVLVVADLVADRFLTGWATRISREAPVLILEQESIDLVPGGGANAVANVRSLGGRPLPFGQVGADEGGSGLLDELSRRGIDTTGVALDTALSTPTKTRILGGSTAASRQQIVRIDSGDRVDLEPEARSALLDRLEESLGAQGEGSVVVFSDYGYGIATPELYGELRSRRPDLTVLVDSRYRLAEYDGVAAATPNQEEAEALAGESLRDDEAVLLHGEPLRRKLGARSLLITRGRHGMALCEEAGVALVPIYGTDQVVDVTGAGDTVIGTFSLALAAGASGLEAALLANYAGGVAVMKAGTATVSADDLRRALDSDPELAQRVRFEEAG